MSRVGKQPVEIPAKTKVEVKGQTVLIEGPKGKLEWTVPSPIKVAMKDGKVVSLGKVGREIDLPQAAEAARLCTLNALANAKAALGSLDKVVRVVMVNGFVNGIDGFSDSPKVLNGTSEFLLQVFGDAGKHARAAVSVNGLPLGASVEVQIILEVR